MFDPLHKWLGIPISEQPPNHYRLLGITLYEDDPEVIDSAADKHLAFLHDMTNGEYAELAEDLSNQISAARLRLLNKEKKTAYDQQLRLLLATTTSTLSGSRDTPIDDTDRLVLDVAPTGTMSATSSLVGDANAVAYQTRDSQGIGSEVLSSSAMPRLRNRLSSKEGKQSRSNLRLLLYLSTPGTVMLIVLSLLIATGKVRLDRQRLESIGVPFDQAALLAGEGPTIEEVSPPVVVQQNDLSEPQSSPPKVAQKSPASTPSMQNQTSSVTQGSGGSSTRPVSPRTISSPVAPMTPERTTSISGSLDTAAPYTSPANDGSLPKKDPLPSDSDLAAKMTVVRELYEEQYRSAKTSQGKLSLAQEILRAAEKQAIVDPVGQFALWRVARDIFSGESDFEAALDVADRMHNAFEGINVIELKGESMHAVKAVKDSQVDSFAESAISIANECMAQGKFREAKSLCVAMRRMLRARIPTGLASDLKILEMEIEDADKLSELYEASVVHLKTSPDDGEALSVTGKYLCLVENRWEEGLPRLVQGSNAKLSLAAKYELDAGQADGAELMIADAWFDASQEASASLEKRRLVEQASRWYEAARPNSQGLEQMKIDRRLEEISASQVSGASTQSMRLPSRGLPITRPQRSVRSDAWNHPRFSTDFATVQGNVINLGMGSNPSGQGEACGGIVLEGAKKVYVVGVASQANMATIDNYSKTGFIIDYHRIDGSYKRVFLGCGTRFGLSYSTYPLWGSGRIPDDTTDLGRRNQYTIDLKQWAPDDWSGSSWFSVYMQNTGTDCYLTATVNWE